MGKCCTSNKMGKTVIDEAESRIFETVDENRIPSIELMSKSSTISMIKGQFNDCFTLGTFLGNDAISEMRICNSKQNEVDSRRYLVKIVSKAKLNRLERQFFQVEISVLKQLKHPGIAEVVDVFEDERNYFVVSEYYDFSISLQEFLESKKNGITELEICYIV